MLSRALAQLHPPPSTTLTHITDLCWSKMFSALGRWASPPSHPRPPRNSGATAFPAFGQSSAGDKPRRGPYAFESGRSVTPGSVRTDDGLGVSQEGGCIRLRPRARRCAPQIPAHRTTRQIQVSPRTPSTCGFRLAHPREAGLRLSHAGIQAQYLPSVATSVHRGSLTHLHSAVV